MRYTFIDTCCVLTQYAKLMCEAGMDLLGGGEDVHPPSPGQRGCRGVIFFMIKQKIIRDKVRYSNLSNNMMISEL
jgi:hypothetical protein